MSAEPRRTPALLRGALVALLTVGVPAAAIPTVEGLRSSIIRTAAFVAIYEAVLLLAKFAAGILAGLQGRWTTRLIDTLDARLQRRFSRFSRMYLRYITAGTRYMDVKGLTTIGEHILKMEDVLVRLVLTPTAVHALKPSLIPYAFTNDIEVETSIWNWLEHTHKEHCVLAIVGPPGSGKTTLLRSVAYGFASGQARRLSKLHNKIPVLINLREHRNWSSTDGFRLREMLHESLSALDREPPPAWLESNLRHGNLAIFLDGLDEMRDDTARSMLVTWIENLANSHPENLVVLTSRPFGYRENPINGATVVEIQPLSEEHINRFITNWYRAISIRSYGADNESSRLSAKTGAADLLTRLDSSPRLSALTANPLLLTMIANVHRYRGALPGTRAELYGEICEVLLGKRHVARGVPVDIPGPQKQVVLRTLAYSMMQDRATDISESKAKAVIEPVLLTVTDVLAPAEFLRSIEEASGLLVEKERGIYTFAHLTFQEYLAAEHVRDNRLVSRLLTHLDSAWWRETIRLFAAISDATPVIEACLEQDGEVDLLVLAAHCVDEGREVGQLARRAVDMRLNPSEGRTNTASRGLAAQARLQLKASRDLGLDRKQFMSSSAITWLEYQYFIDTESRTSAEHNAGALIPDHWVDGVYPEGADTDPVRGIRHDDASRFCAWLSEQARAGFQYRLPYASEIGRALTTGSLDLSSTDCSYWTASSAGEQRDGRFWPLLRDHEQNLNHDAYPLRLAADDLQGLTELLAADVVDVSGSLPGPYISSLRELIARCCNESSICDPAQLERDTVLAKRLVSEYTALNPTNEPNVLTMHSGLQMLANRLIRSTSYALDRAQYKHRRTPMLINERRNARRAAIQAAATCIELHLHHSGYQTPPPRHSLPKPTRRNPNPSRLPQVATTVLAHAFVSMYIDLVVLEARISGQIQPREALLYVRDAAEQGTDRHRIVLDDVAHRTWNRLKPVFDRAAAVILLVMLAPLMLVISGAILTGGRPALFRQTRMGRQGREFKMFKFRTMIVDADARLKDLYTLNEGNGILFKLRDDPRTTRIGRFLRRYSLDELPQLFNVLAGHMSMVGPRPPLPSEARLFDDIELRRLLIKPGLTGLWQVSGRSDLTWEESVRLDIRYVDESSLALDLLILWKTIGAVLRAEGAY